MLTSISNKRLLKAACDPPSQSQHPDTMSFTRSRREVKTGPVGSQGQQEAELGFEPRTSRRQSLSSLQSSELFY